MRDVSRTPAAPLPHNDLVAMARELASKPFSEWKAHECRSMVGYVLHADAARLTAPAAPDNV